MNNNNLDTEQQVKIAQNGDRNAYSEIVRQNMTRIVAQTYKMTGDRETAKDLAQETFVTAWEKIGTFKGDGKFSSWLYRIAHNKCLNHIAKQKNEVVDNADNVGFINSPSEIQTDRELFRKELRENIRAFMISLPTEQRTVFELHFYKELTFSETAELTGKALGTVKTLYREAVKKLRKQAIRKGWRE